MRNLSDKISKIGPGALIAAAFIGPGTVTVCSIAGNSFGYSLLWAIFTSLIIAFILQEMSIRVGIITKKGLTELIKDETKNSYLKNTLLILIFTAIIIGNTAYEAGNISGAILGMESLTGTLSYNFRDFNINLLSLIIGSLAFLVLFIGNYKLLEKILISIVIIMSFSFVISAIITKPDINKVIEGFITLKTPENSFLTILGLIGTTVVPYNIFLHSSLVKKKWKNPKDLKIAKIDLLIAIIMGGLISISIIITSASISSISISSAADLALSLEPIYGSFSKFLISLGMISAGLTSAITAPLAASFVACGCFGWRTDLKSLKFRSIWIIILIIGTIISSTGIKLVLIIQFAQIANAVLLPVIIFILYYIMNNKKIFGSYSNSFFQNLIGFLIVFLTIFLSIKSISTLI
ncbi:MAG: manganese transporter [Flavobacteriaceae bacterium]|nr:manganese transporter [Flavobacteriaceae bacterium]|tara:strand:+ start:18298 stop:19521 length:1224 start_codon:yes stop_codon:yes gene_type:complete